MVLAASVEAGAVRAALEREQQQVALFARLFQVPHADYTHRVYPEWDAHDVLAHIVYWHESFAHVIAALGEGRVPLPPSGPLHEVNGRSVEAGRGTSRTTLVRRLGAAQGVIETHIFDESIGLIPYRRGARAYNRLEHLDVVTGHVGAHFWHVVQAFMTGQCQ